MIRKRIYCPYCSGKIISKHEGEIERDFCDHCNLFFYDNPLPVVSTIIVKDRMILLVKRRNKPYKGKWCLPSGFAEIGESIETAALRELEEETNIRGKIIDFIDVDSVLSNYYGDLLFITFEAERISGKLAAGDDAIDVNFFPIEKMPKLAFKSNIRAVETYLRNKQEYWAIIDSFSLSIKDKHTKTTAGDYLSDKLIRIIEKNAETIANRWLEDVKTNKSTRTYAKFDPEFSFERNKLIIGQFGKWLGGYYSNDEIRRLYMKLGEDRKKEGFALSEVLSALSLTRKHIWEFALSQRMWSKTIDIYMTLELERRMMLFFDKAAFHVAKGYEEE
jgi:ADP-ribose pyrophosphatase YjhB (NUDIX family)